MNLPEGTSQTVSLQRKPARSVLLWVVVVLCLGVFGILTISRLRAHEDRRLKWMTQQEMTLIARGGRLTQLKWKLLTLLGPLQQRIFPVSKTLVHLDFKFISLKSGATAWAGLLPPTSTNADGSVAWVMAHEELGPFEHTLTANKAVQLLSSPGIITYDGGQATLHQGSTVRVGSTNIPCGLTVDVLPKTATGAIRLLLGVSSIDQALPQFDGNGPITTNISAACQSFIPNNGGLVLTGKEQRPGGGRACWVIVHVIAVDAKGRPLRL